MSSKAPPPEQKDEENQEEDEFDEEEIPLLELEVDEDNLENEDEIDDIDVDEIDYEAEDEEENEEEAENEEELEEPLIECKCVPPCVCDYCVDDKLETELPENEVEGELDDDDQDDQRTGTPYTIASKKTVEDDTDDNYDYYFDYGDDATVSVVQESQDKGLEVKVDVEVAVEEEKEVIDNLTTIEGLVGITLSEKTKQYFGVENLSAESSPKYAWLNWKKVKLHMFTLEETSEFTPFYEQIKYYPDLAMLLGVDTTKQTGHNYYLCLTIEARNRVLNPPKETKLGQKKEEESTDDMVVIYPRKWRGFMSELEVDQEKVTPTRPPVTIRVHRLKTLFGAECKFQNYTSDNPSMCASFPSEDTSQIPFVHRMEMDCGTQVKGPTSAVSTQTGPVFKRNKMIQHSIQSIAEEDVTNIMNSEGLAAFFRKALPRLEKALVPNGMVNMLFNEYNDEDTLGSGLEMFDEEEEGEEEEEIDEML